jgi:hypothetical protein
MEEKRRGKRRGEWRSWKRRRDSQSSRSRAGAREGNRGTEERRRGTKGGAAPDGSCL